MNSSDELVFDYKSVDWKRVEEAYKVPIYRYLTIAHFENKITFETQVSGMRMVLFVYINGVFKNKWVGVDPHPFAVYLNKRPISTASKWFADLAKYRLGTKKFNKLGRAKAIKEVFGVKYFHTPVFANIAAVKKMVKSLPDSPILEPIETVENENAKI